MATAELFNETLCELGEGPVWDHRSNTLHWVDIMGQKVHRLRPNGDVASLAFAEPVGAVALRDTVGLVVCLASRIIVTGNDSESVGIASFDAPEADDAPAVRANDAAIDFMGRLWVGTMATDGRKGTAALYRLDAASNDLTPVVTRTTISNGIGWSPDGELMYFADSATGRVDVFDFDRQSGEPSNRRPFVELPRSQGVPDGLTVDCEGGVWIATWDGGTVRRYGPDGNLSHIVDVPVRLVTSCCFFGGDLTSLAITTARVGLEDAEVTEGMTFVSAAGVAGTKAPLFAG